MAHRVIFAGTPAFAVPSLLALTQDPAFAVELVITQPDKPVGRKKTITPPPVKTAAEKLGIPVWQPGNINQEWSESRITHSTSSGEANHESPDFLVVVAYGQILSKEILAMPNIAPVNVHASLLPRWRGASPIHHAILAGDTETGITVQRMAEKLDTGPILSRESLTIGAQETFVELHDRLAALGASLLTRTLKADLTETVQDETKATFCKKLSRTSGEVDVRTMTAEDIDRRVRALNPWPGVRCVIDGSAVKLLQTALEETPESIPVECMRSTLYITKVQPEGRTAMTGKEWQRGKR